VQLISTFLRHYKGGGNEWWNFRLSCQRCNRPEKDENGVLRGKANEFPVHDEANRSLAAADPVIPPESKGLRKWNFLGKMHEEILNEVDQI
jgi:hypothetical protein